MDMLKVAVTATSEMTSKLRLEIAKQLQMVLQLPFAVTDKLGVAVTQAVTHMR